MHELGVSRTPIREAIIRLAKDGLVTVVPRRQTLVSEVRIGHLAEISEVRAELEGFAAGLAAERFAPEDAGELADLLDELDRLERLGDRATLIELDRKVHDFVYRTCRNAFLTADVGSRYYYLSLGFGSSSTASLAWTRPSGNTASCFLRSRRETPSPQAGRSRHVTAFEEAIRRVL